MKKRLGLLLWLGMTAPVFADDSQLPEVLARLRQSGPNTFQYRETRRLELAASPWQAQGVMLTDAAGTLVKLQLQPSRVIMAISGDSLYYWDAAQNQRHSLPISYADDAAMQILIFRSILQGRIQELQVGYELAADIQNQHWSLRMQPNPDQAGENAPSIDISGDADPDKRQILIRQADGETTEYRIEKAADQQAAAYTIPQLLQEAGGE